MSDRSVWDRIECVPGDLTRQDVDAVVNAANSSLRGGGGVDGALHRAAGPELLAACIREHPDGCPTGDVRLTPGFRLTARFVIHAVGPVWRGGSRGEPELLASCYERALDLAAEQGLRTLAFPAISCGVYGYPWPAAAEVALSALARGLQRHASLTLARIVLFHPELHEIYVQTRQRLSKAE